MYSLWTIRVTCWPLEYVLRKWLETPNPSQLTTYVIETSLYFNPPEVLLGEGGRVMEEKVAGKSSDYVLGSWKGP